MSDAILRLIAQARNRAKEPRIDNPTARLLNALADALEEALADSNWCKRS